MFKDIFKGRVVIVGIGNVLRGDDGFGPAFIAAVKDKIKACCIDAGTTPENYIGKIIKERPDTVLLVDAAHLGLRPGEHAVLRKGDILNVGFTTHDMPPHMFIERLESETGASVYMLALQPENVDFGEGLSGSVNKSLQEMIERCTNPI
ncbi:MAG: hydrogenase 3 maturation endopeptidase HyCI [Candidatus Omnitrophica bacterium]|nr:hydrogenase 3 maturation endopeptidase HyCI [Candidatus Omnitrophota bacterium]